MPKCLTFFFLVLLLGLTSVEVFAQACACPPSSTCKPCSGGYTALTLRYNGSGPAVILVKDGNNIVLDITTSATQEFIIKGSKKNEKFADKNVQVFVNGLPNTLLGSSCRDLSVGLTYGNFTVVSAESISGSIVCCLTPPPDVTPPLITNLPGTINAEATNGCNAKVEWQTPIAVDDCTLKSFTSSHVSGELFSVGTTTVVYTATDEAGLVSTASFNIIISDQKAPVFTSFPTDITVAATSECSARVTWDLPQATDQCSGITITSSHQPDEVFETGITKVKFTATDESGNATEKELTINVEDRRTLKIFNCPDDIERMAEGNALTRVSWIVPGPSDSCDPVVLESNYKPDDLFQIGITPVEYVASTPSGKTAYCKFNITIEEKKLKISKLITPDGDGLNDEWVVGDIDTFRDNQVVIFDRWGGIIFQAARYDNESVVWRGTNTSGASVPTGTYFYTIIAHRGEHKIHESGALELVR